MRGWVPSEQRSDSQPITDAQSVLRQAFGRDVLAKLAPRERHVGQLLPPVRVVLGGIGVHRLPGSAVHREIRV